MGYFESIGIQPAEWERISEELAREINGVTKIAAGTRLLAESTAKGDKYRHDFIKAMMFGLVLRQ